VCLGDTKTRAGEVEDAGSRADTLNGRNVRRDVAVTNGLGNRSDVSREYRDVPGTMTRIGLQTQ